MNAGKLKPCPFCGGTVKITQGLTGAPFLFFKCKNKDCGALISFDNDVANATPILAIENYRKRVSE